MAKKLLACAVLMGAFLMMSGTASAVLDPIYYPPSTPYSYTITHNQWMDTSGENFTYIFDLDSQTPMSLGDPIWSANLGIEFSDAEGSWSLDLAEEHARITLDGTIRDNNWEVDTATRTYNVLSDVTVDHALNANVLRLDGDFRLLDATLSGTYGGGNTANPDFFESLDGPGGLMDENSNPFVFTFDLDDEIYDSSKTEGDIESEDDINYAVLTIAFGDDESDNKSWKKDYVSIFIDDSFYETNREIDTETWWGNVYAKLQDDHILTVTVDGLGGDFYLYNAAVGGEWFDNPTPTGEPGPGTGGDVVPEPASLTLLGMGLLGIFGFKRKRR